ncbi:MAG: agmatinase [Planctomycetes bacterium]|nr:agmatinase [Planctomycetota bacterium]
MVAIKPFAGALCRQEIQGPGVYVLGCGYDGTSCFRKGADLGPRSLRAVSSDIERYSPDLDLDFSDLQPVVDLGDVVVPENCSQEQAWKISTNSIREFFPSDLLRSGGVRPLLIGGEHSVSYGLATSFLEAFDDLVVLHLDAHADLRDEFQGMYFSHACVIHRICDHFGPGHTLLQHGIRSGTRDEFEWMSKRETLENGRDRFLDKLKGFDARPLYLTLDLDGFDPSLCPGTGTPEPGGFDYDFFRRMVICLKDLNLVGADVVELCPPVDPTGISTVLAAKVVRELLLLLGRTFPA